MHVLYPLISLVHELFQHVIVCNFAVPESLYLNAACTDDCLINTMSTYCISVKAVKEHNPLYEDFIDALCMACNVHGAADISENSVELRWTRQVLKGGINYDNDDYNDELFDDDDNYNMFDIDNLPPDSLRSFTRSLVAYIKATNPQCIQP